MWTSVCTDKEACYILMGKLQREVNPGFVATSDASHGMESLFDDVEKGFPWLERVLSIIDKVHSRPGHLRRNENLEEQLTSSTWYISH